MRIRWLRAFSRRMASSCRSTSAALRSLSAARAAPVSLAGGAAAAAEEDEDEEDDAAAPEPRRWPRAAAVEEASSCARGAGCGEGEEASGVVGA